MAPTLRQRPRSKFTLINVNLLLIFSAFSVIISFYVGLHVGIGVGRSSAGLNGAALVSNAVAFNNGCFKDCLDKVKGDKKYSTHVNWIWAVDADVPPVATSVLKSIADDDSVGRVRAFCGTRQCYTYVEALNHENIELHFLRVAKLSHYSGILRRHLASQQMQSILRLRLPGFSFEQFVQLGAILGVLWRAVIEDPEARHVYFDPLLPLCTVRKLISLPEEEQIPWQITYSESSVAPSQLSWVDLIALGSRDSTESKRVLEQAVLRLESKLHLPRGEELLHHNSLETDWGRNAVCGVTDGHCISTADIDPSCAKHGSFHLSRYFHLPGYGSHAGCRGNPGLSLRQRYEFAEGDVYQTLAALPFVPRVDGFIDINVGYPSFNEVRNMPGQTWKKDSHSVQCNENGCLRKYGSMRQDSTLGDCSSEWTTEWPMPPPNNGTIYFITAGRWFEHFDGETKHSWPPPSHITPIFVGHRIEKPPSDKVLQWMKKYQQEDGHGAIGVRDVHSQNIFCKNGVRAIFTGDLTLSLRTLLDSSPTEESLAEENGEILVFASGRVTSDRTTCDKSNFGFPRETCVNHHWALDNSTIWHLGHTYDLVHRSHRHQVALETLRRLQKAKGAVTTKQFHVLIPSLGLNKPVAFYGQVDNRLMGYELAIPVKSKGFHESIVDIIQSAKPTAEAENLRRKLVVRTRMLLAQENPLILDTMHRLGPFDAYSQGVDDAAWMSGQLPKSLMEGFSAEDLLYVADPSIECNG